jgi:TetR/AcrR family transcriptional regulator
MTLAPRQPGRCRMAGSDRRAQLIEVALDVFSRRGFRGATTKEIAAEAGVAEAVIFHHFPSKDALYTAVLDSRLGSAERQQRHAELLALMERDDDEAVFGALVRNICTRYAHDTRFERVVLFAALEGHREVLDHLSESGGAGWRAVKAYVARRQKAGCLGAGDPGRLLLAINGMAHFYGIVTRIFEMPMPGGSDQSAIDLFTQIALHGVSCRKSTTTRKKANQ